MNSLGFHVLTGANPLFCPCCCDKQPEKSGGSSAGNWIDVRLDGKTYEQSIFEAESYDIIPENTGEMISVGRPDTVAPIIAAPGMIDIQLRIEYQRKLHRELQEFMALILAAETDDC